MKSAMSRPLTTLLLACLLPLTVNAEDTPTANPQPSAEQRATLPERSAQDAEALQRRLPQSEQQMLQAGEESFLALWRPASSPQPKGVIILLPGAGESADWPQVLQPLRNKFPGIGWSSLSLSLPDGSATAAEAPPTPGAKPSIEEDSSAETAEPGNAAPAADSQASDPAERIFARMQAAIAFAEQQEAKDIVLLGHGEGAYWAALFIKEQQPTTARYLASISAQLPAGQKPALDELLPGLELPVGDFFYKDQQGERSAAALRLQASKRLGRQHYSQVALQALPADRSIEQEQLYRRVRGWLEKQ